MSSMPHALPDRAIERLFARFAAMYGDAAMKRMWGQQSAEAVKGIWAVSLSRFSMEQMLNGLRVLEDAGKSFPPTLPEFIAACQHKPEPVPAMHKPLLPPPDRTPEEMAAAREKVEQLVSRVGRQKQGDPLRWAYRVIERYRAKDRMVAHMSYTMALAALTEAGREIPK